MLSTPDLAHCAPWVPAQLYLYRRRRDLAIYRYYVRPFANFGNPENAKRLARNLEVGSLVELDKRVFVELARLQVKFKEVCPQ